VFPYSNSSSFSSSSFGILFLPSSTYSFTVSSYEIISLLSRVPQLPSGFSLLWTCPATLSQVFLTFPQSLQGNVGPYALPSSSLTNHFTIDSVDMTASQNNAKKES
jgi:hypothetical protein